MLQYQYISALFDCGIRCSLPPLNQNLMFPSAVCIFFCSVLDLKKKNYQSEFIESLAENISRT